MCIYEMNSTSDIVSTAVGVLVVYLKLFAEERWLKPEPSAKPDSREPLTALRETSQFEFTLATTLAWCARPRPYLRRGC